jgi:hypothetical protein
MPASFAHILKVKVFDLFKGLEDGAARGHLLATNPYARALRQPVPGRTLAWA